MLLTWDAEMITLVAKGPSLARSLSLPPGLVPAPYPTPLKLSPLNDVADEAEDRVLHGRSCPWPDHPQSSTLSLLSSIPDSQLCPVPQDSYSFSRGCPK